MTLCICGKKYSRYTVY